MQGVATLSQRVSFRLSVACATTLVFAWLAQAQSLDDVHVTPHRKLTTQPSTMDVAPIRGLPTLEPHIKPLLVDVDLVLIPVTVTDGMNRPVTTLQKQNFALYEGGKPQNIQYFFEDEEPLSVAVLVDVSKSMSDKIEIERTALKDFFNNANPQDEYSVITFSDRPRLLGSPSTSIDEIQRQLMLAEPGGPTAMLDAIYLAEAQLRRARYKRKAIIIFSDGGDNVSHYTQREVKALVREGDIDVYAIGLFETTFVFGSFEEKLGSQWLRGITDATGGHTITVEKRDKVPEAAASISREMRSRYVLGYRPSLGGNGKWRKIEVRVTSAAAEKPVRAYYKNGYISPEK